MMRQRQIASIVVVALMAGTVFLLPGTALAGGPRGALPPVIHGSGMSPGYGCDVSIVSSQGGGCDICCPPLLPALFYHIDCFLQKVFYCDSDYQVARCGPILPSYRTKSGCGSDGVYDAPVQELMPTDPFEDDPLGLPVPTVSNQYRLRNKQRPTAYTSARRPQRSTRKVGTGVPRALDVPHAQPLKQGVADAPRRVARKPSRIRATSTSAQLKIPDNPLR
ncbi:MAG: hypothetical protein ACC628_16565 [Pirellulaceae bacterium]